MPWTWTSTATGYRTSTPHRPGATPWRIALANLLDLDHSTRNRPPSTILV